MRLRRAHTTRFKICTQRLLRQSCGGMRDDYRAAYRGEDTDVGARCLQGGYLQPRSTHMPASLNLEHFAGS
eukprot:4819886-Pyramimonas_sp.AAC.1